MAQDKLIIFDTTLRDGEQSPGASMTLAEKVRIAKQLEQMRVDVIEAGFPVASPGDWEAVNAVAKNVKDSTVCGLARALDKDIEAAGSALADAASARIHTFIATSPIHMEQKLKMSPEQVLEQAVYAVKKARQYTDDVEFSAEDAGRSEFDFLCKIVELAINAGATTINIPDTVGYNVPAQFGDTIRRLIENVPNSDKAIFSTHCHNDLGLAVANSLAGVVNGARQVECTINGLGERAGNAALEEIVMAIKTRQDVFDCDTGIDTRFIVPASRLVSSITGFSVQPNKAIVGKNAFAHESGIHQDGVLKSRETYEIMKAEDVGWSANQIVLGKHSGRSALRSELERLGIDVSSEEELNEIFKRFKDLADKKHDIFDDDIRAITIQTYEDEDSEPQDYELLALDVSSVMGEEPSADITLKFSGQEIKANGTGSGAVDAVYSAIKSVVHEAGSLELYSVNNITSGTDSQGEVSVRLSKEEATVYGSGTDTDIVIASAKAYLDAINKLSRNVAQRAHPQSADV